MSKHEHIRFSLLFTVVDGTWPLQVPTLTPSHPAEMPVANYHEALGNKCRAQLPFSIVLLLVQLTVTLFWVRVASSLCLFQKGDHPDDLID